MRGRIRCAPARSRAPRPARRALRLDGSPPLVGLRACAPLSGAATAGALAAAAGAAAGALSRAAPTLVAPLRPSSHAAQQRRALALDSRLGGTCGASDRRPAHPPRRCEREFPRARSEPVVEHRLPPPPLRARRCRPSTSRSRSALACASLSRARRPSSAREPSAALGVAGCRGCG